MRNERLDLLTATLAAAMSAAVWCVDRDHWQWMGFAALCLVAAGLLAPLTRRPL